MATVPPVGAQFVPASQEAIRDQLLADYRLEMIRNGVANPAVQPRTETHAWATSQAAALMLLYSGVALSRDAITPLNATGDDLENWRIALGLVEVNPGPSTGKIRLTVSAGSGSIADGENVTLPNGLRAVVLGTWVGVVDGSEIDVVSVDKGTASNFPADTEVRFPNPPFANLSEKAKVSRNQPLTGGTDAEDDDHKRSRVLNAIPNKPGGGNWGQYRQIATEELPSIQDAFVYPALGGPGSAKVVPVVDFDEENSDYTRVPSDAAIAVVRNAIYREMSDGVENVIQAPAFELVSVAVAVDIPDSSLDGGDGSGWLDQSGALWPRLEGGDNGRVTVTNVTGSTTITVSALTTEPVAGQTRIVWWSPDDMRFRTYLVTATSGSAGARVITLDRPLVSSNGVIVAVDDYISPAAVRSEAYGTSWLAAMRKLGPGENTADADRLPRAGRHPFLVDEWPSSLSFQTLRTFQESHPEIADISWGYRSLTSPTVPASASDAPNILTPQHFGIYPV